MSDPMRHVQRVWLVGDIVDGAGDVGDGGDGARRGDPTSRVSRVSIDRAAASIGWVGPVDPASVRRFAQQLMAERDESTVCVLLRDRSINRIGWLESSYASGWIIGADARAEASRDPLASVIDDALGRGFVGADAALLGFAGQACESLPLLTWDDDDVRSRASLPRVGHEQRVDARIGLYAIVDSAAAVRRAIDAGITTVQLRIKRPLVATAEWEASLEREARAALAMTSDAGAELVINDHWRLAAEHGIASVHLGQDDLATLGPVERAALAGSGVRLGISSHSVWELCRARSMPTRYIACGPVWPTTTKDMPWLPQGPDNLGWWCANAGRPVVAIGGILQPRQARIAARSGADGVCLVRALGDEPSRVVPQFRDAFNRGLAERHEAAARASRWPHPTLP